jgi:hypothetical protein
MFTSCSILVLLYIKAARLSIVLHNIEKYAENPCVNLRKISFCGANTKNFAILCEALRRDRIDGWHAGATCFTMKIEKSEEERFGERYT